MKKLAITLIVLVLALGGLIGYGLFNTSLSVIGQGFQKTPASQRSADFETLRQNVEKKSLLGTMLKNETLGDASRYSYYIYTLRIKNPGLVPAEMVELQIAPIEQDVLFYTDTVENVIPPGETRDIWCVLLTEGEPYAVRDIYITYYLWGHEHEVKFTYENH